MGGIFRLLYVFLFVCPVKLFSAVAGPIGAKLGMRHEPDASQISRDFGGAIPRDGEIIAENVRIRGRMGPKYQIKFANSGKTMRRSVRRHGFVRSARKALLNATGPRVLPPGTAKL